MRKNKMCISEKEYGTLGSICNPLVEIQMLFYVRKGLYGSI